MRVLREFAFDAGASPDHRLVTESEEASLMRRAITATNALDFVFRDLAAYGYVYRHRGNGGQSPADSLRKTLHKILGLLRDLRVKDPGQVQKITSAIKADLDQSYGPVRDPEALPKALRDRVDALLQAFPDSPLMWAADDYGKKLPGSSVTDFKRDYQNLRRALETDALQSDWKLWNELRGLRTKIRTMPMRQEYVALADGVQNAARQITVHPGPLDEAKRHIHGLLVAGLESLKSYKDLKKKAGVIDYQDMIATAAKVIESNEDVQLALSQRIDCMVVDEFQDTNPLQAVLLWAMKKAGIPTLVVGDTKQAIMGFQGADARLMEALEQGPDTESLPNNWRSQPDLMEICNGFGAALFSDSYEPLAPKANSSKLKPLEVIRFKSRPKRDGHRVRALHVGQRLIELLENPQSLVFDRDAEEPRPLRASDIAVLCRRNGMLSQYAEVLRNLGLQVNIQQDEWRESRPVEIMRHALAYVADPSDVHAALYLSVTELGSQKLDEALMQLIAHRRGGH